MNKEGVHMHQHKLITLVAYSVWIININPSIAYNRSINKIRNFNVAIGTITWPNLRVQKKALNINKSKHSLTLDHITFFNQHKK